MDAIKGHVAAGNVVRLSARNEETGLLEALDESEKCIIAREIKLADVSSLRGHLTNAATGAVVIQGSEDPRVLNIKIIGNDGNLAAGGQAPVTVLSDGRPTVSGEPCANPFGQSLDATFRLWPRPPVVIISGCGIDCTGGAQRPAALARAFAASGTPVVYVQTRVPCLYAENGILVCGDQEWLQQVAPALRWMTSTVILGYPALIDLIGPGVLGRDWTRIFDLFDDWPAFLKSGDCDELSMSQLKYCVEATDVTVCSATALVDIAKQLGAKRTALIRNGGPSEPVAPWREKEPSVVFCGSLWGSWIDWDIMDAVADGPWDLHIIGQPERYGKIMPQIAKLSKRPNVHIHGPMPHQKALRQMASSAVSIIPFRDAQICASVDPVKLYDGYATELPTVATPVLIELADRPGVTLSDGTTEGFVSAVSEAIERGRLPHQEAVELCRDNSWAHRVSEFNAAASSLSRVEIKRPDEVSCSWKPPVQDWPECKLRIAWTMATSCGADCFHCCAADDIKQAVERGDRWWTNEQAIAAWQHVHDDYGPVVIEASGLEGMDNSRLLGQVADVGHRLMVNTNLTFDLKRIREHIGQPDRFQLPKTFHPHLWKWDTLRFLEKVSLVQAAGFNVSGVSVVAHPGWIERIPEWTALFRSVGLATTAHPYSGKHEERWYPQAFDERQRALIGLEVTGEKATFAMDRKAPNTLCAAGWVYANIALDGSVSRCLQNPTRVCGNFYREPLRFLQGPSWCHSTMCVCEQFFGLHCALAEEPIA
jgi:hypothetical protein